MNPKAQILAGVALMALAGVLALADVIVVPALMGVGGLVLVVSGALRLSTIAPHGELVQPPEHLAPLTLLEALRRFAVVAGAAATVLATTAFRFDLFSDEISFAAIPLFLVGALLFVRAYWAGTPIRTPLPKQSDLWDRGVAWVEEHGAIPALIVLVNVTGVMYASVFIAETIGDDLTFHMAESARLADCIRDGDWDLWNPSANGGYATAYYYQVIPQLASALPSAIFGHHLFFFQVTLWLPQVATPVCAYRGMRMMGASPWQSVTAAFAVTFVSGASRWGTGADGTFQVGLYTQTWALAAFPLGLGYGVRWLTEGKSLASAIGWGAFVFLCHPFASIGLCLGLAVGVLAHYLAKPARHPVVKFILLALLVGALAVNLIGLVFDPMTAKDVTGWRPKIIYIAPMIVFAALIVRIVTRGRVMTALLLGGVAIAFVANAIGFVVFEGVPPRPEGVTTDLPAQWTIGGASLYIGPLLMLAAIAGRLALSLRGADAATAVEPAPEPPLGGALGAMTRAPRLLLLAGVLLVTLGAFVFVISRGHVIPALAGGAVMLAVFVWLAWPTRDEPLVRLVAIGIGLAVATAPGWLTVIVDRDGFGGFPHRVSDEVGPGYQELMRWYTHGAILDNNRWVLMTWSLPIVFLFARMQFARWLWAPSLTFAALLALGPHAPKTADDLLPAVRFLGSMQVTLALGIGAGMYAIGATIWNMRAGTLLHGTVRAIAGAKRAEPELQYGVRTAVVAIACALVIFVGLMGARALSSRVNVLSAYDYRGEMMKMIDIIEKQPQGRKQVGPGCENHWWNLLSYVYAKRPSLLQMGGGGLQASPNYDFLWSVRDFPKLAWVYDTPLFLFAKTSSSTAPAGEVLGETKRYELRRLEAPGVVSAVQITGVLPAGESRADSPVRKAAIDWLRSQNARDNKHLAYYGHGEAGGVPDAKVLRAFRVDPSPGDTADIYADVDVKSTTTFVARESWHPRWHAYVDGREVPIRRITPDFPAIDVAPGKHTLAFRFERPWWAHAVWLGWPGAVFGAWFALRWLRRRHQLPAARAKHRARV